MDFPDFDRMSDDEALMFKKGIRKLLDVTFIVGDRDEKLYNYFSSESVLYDVNAYLSVIGYRVIIDEQLRVIMMTSGLEEADTPGLKRANLLKLDKNQVQLLLVLWLFYLEKMGYKEPVFVTVGEIVDKCKLYKINLKPADFQKAYAIFKRYQLIQFSGQDITEVTAVELYPSLQFCMDTEQFKAVVREYAPESMEEITEDE